MKYFAANVYALRVNLSVAIVAMTQNYTITYNGTQTMVSEFFVTVYAHTVQYKTMKIYMNALSHIF